jgi:putative flavoprotein involved in K+ transport
LPVELDSRVRSVRQADNGYLVDLDDRTYETEQVVIATGPFQIPRVPDLAGRLDPGIVQLHSDEYRAPEALPDGRVLVVGGGNTGYQIAEELSRTREVHLSIGARQTPLPQRMLGRDLFRYLEGTGLMTKTVESRIGRRMQHRDTLIGSSPRAARRHGIRLHGRTVDMSGSIVRFAEGAHVVPDAVVWASGYRLDHSLVQLPVFDKGGRLAHRRGVTASIGLYFLGLPWQHTRGSALLGWVNDDAEHIARHIADRSTRRAVVPA